MKPDIESRIAADYLVADHREVQALLELVNEELRRLEIREPERSRICRCILFLASGDLSRLYHDADQALMDFRDVIYWAEYDANDCQLRDFNEPFTKLDDVGYGS